MLTFFNLRRLRQLALLSCLLLACNQAGAQLQRSDSTVQRSIHRCGLTPAMIAQGHTPAGSGAPQSIAASQFPTSAIVTCGKFDVYYEDMIAPNQTGFNDPSQGPARRATFCAVLNYIQTVFDFSNVSNSNHIKVHVEKSFDNTNPAPAGNTFLAFAIPQYDPSATGIVNGYIRDYIVTGIPTANPDGYHTDVTVNFDRNYPQNSPVYNINYMNDYTQAIAPCQIDLFSVLLHEMGHALGWFSMVTTIAPQQSNVVDSYVHMPLVPNNNGFNRFTGLDYGMYQGTPGNSMNKIITGTTASPVLNTSITVGHDVWTNNLNAPNNDAVFSGALLYADSGAIGSYFSHLDAQLGSFSYRQRISPGDVPDYVMGPYGFEGLLRRSYTKGEIKTFQNSMGYPINPSFQTGNPILLTNRPPHSTRMAGYSNYRDFKISETITPDYTLTNNTGSSLTIDLGNATTRSASGITDLDNDPVSVMPGTLVNFRGCGNGGNNHNQLAVSGNGQVITYTPRPGFYGRAQFGFNLWDGKEKGAYIVYTIDVKRGTNVTVTPGTNLVVNGSFEEGTETKRVGTEQTIPNASIFAGAYEQKLSGGFLSDGHPWSLISNPWGPTGGGTVIENSGIMCSDATLIKSAANTITASFPNSLYPAGGSQTGQRYQYIHPSSINGQTPIIGLYYYLKNDVQPCHRYTLTFDAKERVPGATQGTFNLGFLNDITSTVDYINPSPVYQVTGIPYTASNWQSFSVSFWYCGTAPANVLNLMPSSGYSFLIDNISLTEDLNPAPITVTISQAPATGCTTQLTATADFGTSYHCNATYTWNNGMTGATITVPNSSANAYTVTVTDGCRTGNASVTLPSANPITVTGNQGICAGSSVVLSETGITNPTWSPATGLSCTTCATTTATPTATTTYTVTGTDNIGCAVSEQVVVTVTPIPVITVTGNTAICQGSGTQLQAQATGVSNFTWTPSTGLSCTSCANPIASPTTSTGYTVTGTVNGCSSSTPVNITVTPTPVVTVTPAAVQICTGRDTTLKAFGATTYSWSPTTGVSCPTCATTLVNPSSTTTYTVTGTTNGCSSTAQATVTVAPCLCVNSVFGVGNYATLTGTIINLPASPSGYFYVSGNVTIGASMTIYNKQILLASGASITVPPGVTLDLATSHLFTCPGSSDYWKGIAVNGNGTTSGKVIVRDNTLIEDAVSAITFNSPVTPSSGNVLTVTNSVFNRNTAAIQVSTYNPAISSYPFSIQQSVFTSRNLGIYSGYPMSWPSAASLSAATSNGAQAPYVLAVTYAPASLKGGGEALAGVVLNTVGNTSGGNYYGALIGDGSANTYNLFDNLRYGIEGHNASFGSVNNVFINMKAVSVNGAPATGGSGIYADANPAQFLAGVQVVNAANGQNKFYDCVNGVEANNIYAFNGNGAYMSSSHLYPSTATGQTGYKIRSAKYGQVLIGYNSIYNISTGIYFAALNDQSWYQGQVSINNNTLNAHAPQVANNNSHYMRQAVQLDNLVSCTNCGTVANSIAVQGNTIGSAYNGIAANNFKSQTLSTQLNGIGLVADPGGQNQYGVSITGGNTNNVLENTVTGTGVMSDLVRGYFTGSSGGAKLMCNRAFSIGRGFEFTGQQNGVLWQANFMQDNLKGFVLSEAIGQQGSPTGNLRGYAASNNWLGTNWNSGRYQTYTINFTDPLSSRMYVNSGANYNPTANWNNITRVPSMYATGNGLTVTTASNAVGNCIPNTTPAPPSRSAQAMVVRNQVPYTTGEAANQWMAQLAVWQQVTGGVENAPEGADEGYRSDLQALTDFRSGAAGTRFGWVTDMENALNSGDLDKAGELLDKQPASSGTFKSGTATITDNEGANGVVGNYAAYYGLLLSYLQSGNQLEEADRNKLAELAGKCPAKDGAVIYQARSLYRVVADDPSFSWNDNACMEGGDAAGKGIAIATGAIQQYHLSPNPNNGEMLLQQDLADEGPVKAVVINAAGMTVYSTELSFKGNATQLNRKGLAAGLYLLRLTDSNGKAYNLKFIVK